MTDFQLGKQQTPPFSFPINDKNFSDGQTAILWLLNYGRRCKSLWSVTRSRQESYRY